MTTTMGGRLDGVDAYHCEVVAEAGGLLGTELIGVYAGGSFALGGFDPYLSDVDMVAVVAAPLEEAMKRALVEALRHESLPCPARGLELVLYADDVVRSGTTEAAFELNLNSGARMAFRADYEPGQERHWFAIDRSILRARGRALLGPPADDLFAPIPRAALLEVVAEAVRWHRDAPGAGSDAILNACRALRFAVEGIWSSKLAAGSWALERHDEARLVARALAARQSQEQLSQLDVGRFLEGVEARVRETAAREALDERQRRAGIASAPIHPRFEGSEA